MSAASPGDRASAQPQPLASAQPPAPGAPADAGIQAGSSAARGAGRRPRNTLTRNLIWCAVLALLVIGLVAFFRFGRVVPPLLGGGR